MIKKEIKQSEARVILYLSVVHPTRKYAQAIATKLGIEYGYLMRLLPPMMAKGWLKKHYLGRKVFYDLTQYTPLELAKSELNGDYGRLQTSLNDCLLEEEIRAKAQEVQNDKQDEE